MSNRQARREQSRSLRTQRASAGGGRGTRRPAGGGANRPSEPSWLTQPFTLIAAALVMVLIVVLAVVLVITSEGQSEEIVTALEEARADLPLDVASGNKLGREDAPLKLTVFEDFQCPYCLKYTANQEPTIVEEFVKAGKVQIIYEHFPAVGKESVFAAAASFCAADQNKFWEYHNALFLLQAKEGQADTERVDVGRFSPEKLKDLGKQVGLPDQAKFEQCVDSGQHDEEIANQMRKARSLGITGTPGFLLNGKPLTGAGALSNLDDWREVLNQAIEQTATPAATGSPPAPTAAATTSVATATAPATAPAATATRAP